MDYVSKASFYSRSLTQVTCRPLIDVIPSQIVDPLAHFNIFHRLTGTGIGYKTETLHFVQTQPGVSRGRDRNTGRPERNTLSIAQTTRIPIEGDYLSLVGGDHIQLNRSLPRRRLGHHTISINSLGNEITGIVLRIVERAENQRVLKYLLRVKTNRCGCTTPLLKFFKCSHQ